MARCCMANTPPLRLDCLRDNPSRRYVTANKDSRTALRNASLWTLQTPRSSTSTWQEDTRSQQRVARTCFTSCASAAACVRLWLDLVHCSPRVAKHAMDLTVLHSTSVSLRLPSSKREEILLSMAALVHIMTQRLHGRSVPATAASCRLSRYSSTYPGAVHTQIQSIWRDSVSALPFERPKVYSSMGRLLCVR